MTEIQLLNYDLLAAFKDIVYKNMLLDNEVCSSEMFVGSAKDEYGMETEYNSFFYPMQKDRKKFLLPTEYLHLLPLEVDTSDKMSLQNKAYHLITDATPSGFGAMLCFKNFKEFVDTLCDYEHESPIDFKLWKLMFVTAYISRVNFRICTPPSFSKDGIINVTSNLMGDVAKISNPSLPKLIWLLTNKVLVTNKVSGLERKDISNLEIYYEQAGDFQPTFEKPTMANIKGSQNTYDISKLSNVVCYNNLDTQVDKEKYFDFAFPGETLNRFPAFKMRGVLLECFEDVRGVRKVVKQNIDYYKNFIKTFKYYEDNPDVEYKGYTYQNPFKKGSRYYVNWSRFMITLDKYSETQQEFDELRIALYERHTDYAQMINDYKKPINFVPVEELRKKEEQRSLK